MYNNLKTKQNEEIKSEGILIFKDTMEYLIDGILTAEQYAELTRMIYATRWGDGVNEKEITDKLLLGIWKTLKHTIKKSARNARYRENNTSKKSALQDTVGTEFNITPVNNIPCNKEIENKPILNPQITQDDNQYQPKVESGLNSLKIGNNEVVEDNTYMEEKPVVKVAANKHNSDVERLQDIINTDNDFYSIYGNCVKAVADYKINSGDTIKANTKEMAMEKLKQLFHSYQIPYNKETHNFFLDDVDYSISNMDDDVA